MKQVFLDFDVPFVLGDLVKALPFVDPQSKSPKPLPALAFLSEPTAIYETITFEPYSLELGNVKRL